MSEIVTKHDLPSSWKWCTLDDVADVGAGNPAPQGENKFENGNMPFVRVRDMGKLQGQVRLHEVGDYVNTKGAEGLKLIKKGSVLFTKSGASTLLNQRAVLGQDSYVVSHIAIAKPKEGILSEWVYYWMRLIDFGKLAHGANMPSLPLSKAKVIPIPLAPPEQQKRIVAKIEELFSHIDAGIEALKKAKQLLKQYRQSVLKAAVTGELTKEWRVANKDKLEPASRLLERILKERRQKWEEFESEKHKVTNKSPKNEDWKKRYKEPIDFDFDDEMELPSEWVQTSLDSVTNLLTDYHANGSYKVLKEYVVLKDEPDHAVYIRSKNFEKEDYTNDLKYVSEEAYKKLWKSKLFGGEIVVGKIGNAGRVYIMPEAKMPTTLGMNLFMLKLNKYVNNEYIYYMLKSSLGALQISRRVKGVGNPTIDKFSLKNIFMPLPSEEEQDVIVELIEDKFEKINRLEKDIDFQLVKAKKNKQSILASAFSGKISQ